MSMFCYQCQETARNQGCTVKGVCGKEAGTAALQDLLIYVTRGVAIVLRALRQKGKADDQVDHYIMDALFCTITNANFDDEALTARIEKGFTLKKDLLVLAEKEGVQVPDMPEIALDIQKADYIAHAASIGV